MNSMKFWNVGTSEKWERVITQVKNVPIHGLDAAGAANAIATGFAETSPGACNSFHDSAIKNKELPEVV